MKQIRAKTTETIDTETKVKYKRDSSLIYPFFKEGCLLMTVSKFVTDEKKELVEILSLPYITPTEYVIDVIKKYIPSYENVHFTRNDIYYEMKINNSPFYYVSDGYEIFLSPILTHTHYGHDCNPLYKDCSPRAYDRYVWTRQRHHYTSCDNCFLTAMNIIIPQGFIDSFNISDHIISYKEMYKKYPYGSKCMSIGITVKST